MKTIALVHQKGGVGKSTLSTCLAVAAHLDGKAAAILDLDPQGSAYKWGKRRCAHLAGLGVDPDPVVLSVTLASLLDEWEGLRAAGADYVFIDTPPRLATEMAEACSLADAVLVPCSPTIKDLEKVEPTIRVATREVAKPTFVVLNSARRRGQRADEAAAFLAASGFPVCPARVSHLVAFDDADAFGLTPQETEPRGQAAESINGVYRYTSKVVAPPAAEEGGNDQATAA